MAVAARALKTLLRNQNFPPVRAAFGYGSGVLPQASNDGGMVDVVLAVDDARRWHAENLERRRGDYSWLGSFGAEAVTSVQGRGVYFNALAPVRGEPGRLMKYGVADTDAVLRDLKEWSRLYVAGRLQKPVVWAARDDKIDAALRNSLDAAFKAALLALPSHFDEPALYEAIAALSYDGDVEISLRLGEAKPVRADFRGTRAPPWLPNRARPRTCLAGTTRRTGSPSA